MPDGADKRKHLFLFIAAAAMFILLLAGELSQEDEPVTLQDMLFEVMSLALLVGCTVSSALLVLRMQAQEETSLCLERELRSIRARSEQWRREMAVNLRELGSAIQAQFEAWGLTPAEQEIGLLLKGFSHKEIARLRRTTEATIRQQAASIYQKARLNGRAALSAFFLEELLLPGPSPLQNDGGRTRQAREASS